MVISAPDIYVGFYGLKNSHKCLCHLICKAFDLYGILSYIESEQSDRLSLKERKV